MMWGDFKLIKFKLINFTKKFILAIQWQNVCENKELTIQEAHLF